MDKIIERKCKVCMHPEREVIDKLLLENLRTGRDIAKTYGISENSISVHKHKHILTGDLRDKLKLIIQDTIMEGIKPDNTDQLTKLMQFVQNMDNEDYKTGKEQWESKVEERLDTFNKIITNPILFNRLDTSDRDLIVRIAQDIFTKDAPRDLGEFIRIYLGMENSSNASE